MNPTFIGPIEHHDFTGFGKPVPASRHVNPDGSRGGYVAASAYAGPRTFVGPDARVCDLAILDDTAQVFGHARIEIGRAHV